MASSALLRRWIGTPLIEVDNHFMCRIRNERRAEKPVHPGDDCIAKQLVGPRSLLHLGNEAAAYHVCASAQRLVPSGFWLRSLGKRQLRRTHRRGQRAEEDSGKGAHEFSSNGCFP